VAFAWPEEPPHRPVRRVPPRSRPGDLYGPTRELFENSDPAAAGGRLPYLVPVIAVIAILLLVGIVLAAVGPLPRIFPQLDCGVCGIHP
jgi:hypothetical protein